MHDSFFLEQISIEHLHSFHQQLLAWFLKNGRHDLPWKPKKTRTLQENLYRIWISEIMLQQTQVTTVIPYFQQFITRFPNIQVLSESSLDEVLQQWEGLGYYTRAKNIHRTAAILSEHFNSLLPQNFAELQSLKGIGRTTAAAILAQGYQRPFAIFDGNVKRVLARITGCIVPANQLEKRLLPYATYLSLHKAPEHYTQAIMDFGALICRKRPDCLACFFRDHCIAAQHQKTGEVPRSAPKKSLPKVTRTLLVIKTCANEYLVERRPSEGIWPDLFSFPEWDSPSELLDWMKIQGLNHCQLETLPAISHRFTHFILTLNPVLYTLKTMADIIIPNKNCHFVSQMKLTIIAKPKPIKNLFNQLVKQNSLLEL